jgi:hypothetical protein
MNARSELINDITLAVRDTDKEATDFRPMWLAAAIMIAAFANRQGMHVVDDLHGRFGGR